MATSAAAAVRPPAAIATDTHAHVFTRSLPLAARRRYSVDYDARPEQYLAMLAANGMGRGVLVQPSFLGFDNGFLVSALALAPDRLRGIVALPNATPREDMVRLAANGIVGVRLNLLGRNDPDLGAPAWRRHLAIVRDLGWQVELQCEAARLPALLPALLAAGVPIVLDHFGRPDAALGIGDPGFRYLLHASGDRIWVKLSGAYRIGAAVADRAAAVLLDTLGPSRLLWGSDWPHTQFERSASTTGARAALDRWVPAAAARAVILADNPAGLFRFGGGAAPSHLGIATR